MYKFIGGVIMVITNEYLKRVMADVEKRNAGETEFLQAVTKCAY